MKTFLKLVAAGQLIIMALCIAEVVSAICSFNAAMVTYETCVTWQMISWGIFIVAGFVCIATAAKADRLEK